MRDLQPAIRVASVSRIGDTAFWDSRTDVPCVPSEIVRTAKGPTSFGSACGGSLAAMPFCCRGCSTPDYDSDPERWRSWSAPEDVHDMVTPPLLGPVLDIGCGDGRLASFLDEPVRWVGVDSSLTKLAANPHRPVVLAHMRHLPFADDSFRGGNAPVVLVPP
jgi:Methyltransferase domain